MPFDLDKAVDWEIVQTGERLETVARELADAKVFGWDTETNGRTVWKGSRIIGHSFAWRGQGKMRACYIPVRHEKTTMLDLFDTGQQLPVESVNAALRPILESAAVKIGHHIRYDMHMAFADGINVEAPVVDTVIACKLVNENHPDYRLRACVSRARIPHDPEWKNAIKGEIAEKARAMGDAPKKWVEKYGYRYLSIPSCGRYAVQDAIYTLKLGEWAIPQQQRWAEIWAMEMRLLFVILRMERAGVPVDSDRLLAIGQAERANMVDYAARIFGMIGKEIELGNDRQMRRLLFDELGYQPVAFTDHGAPQIDDDSLYHLERAGCEVAGWIRKWNRSEKIVTTYTEGIVGLCDQHGVLHGELDQGGARTGRTSMKRPNLQNIPVRTELGRKIREAFLARRGKLRACLDYCLPGDTKIITADGVRSLREVALEGGKVLSCSSEGELGFKEVERGARIGVKPVVEVQFSDGKTICCTADHEWMALHGEKVKARDLKPGDRLRHVRQGRSGVYPTWWWRSAFDYRYCHHLVAGAVLGACPEGLEVDHIDGDHENWRASNLRYLPIGENRGQGARRWWDAATVEQREEKKRRLVAGQASRRSYMGAGNPNFGRRKGVALRCPGCGREFYRPPSLRAKFCSQGCYRGNNYRVVAVRAAGEEEVFHLTVADWHTFVLANGLVSGNSQVEFRVLGHLTQDPLILKVYREGLDAHRMTAIEAFGTADKVGGIDMRRVGKIVNFGVSFGMTEFGLMAFANKDLPEGIPAIGEDQAKDFLRKFYARYASIDRYRRTLFKYIESAPGHEFRNLFGRPRRMGAGFDRKAPNAVRRAEERAAISTIVSGTAADLVKHSMVAVDEYLRAQTDCAEADMVLMVHDDLQFDLSIDGSAKTIRELKRIMEQTCQDRFTVPIVTDVEYFISNWAEKHKMRGL